MMSGPIPHDERGTSAMPRRIRRAGTLSATAPQVARSRVERIGIARRDVAYDRAQRPLTDRQALALSVVTDTARPARDLAPAIGLTANQMSGALLTLAGKNLVIKTQTGWKRAA